MILNRGENNLALIHILQYGLQLIKNIIGLSGHGGDQRGIHGPYNSIKELKDISRSKWNFKGKNKFLYICKLDRVIPCMNPNDYCMANTNINECSHNIMNRRLYTENW